MNSPQIIHGSPGQTYYFYFNGSEPASYARLYKWLDEGLALYGYGDFSDDLKGYPFYDATGVTRGITFALDNPNAIVVGGPRVRGVSNRIEKSPDVMQGFTADSLRLTDGGDFCYDYSVKCPKVTFTRERIPADMRYVTFVLPFAAKCVKGMYEYVDCDGQNVYFNTPADGVISAYLPIVVDMREYEATDITITGEDFVALSPNGVFNVTPAPSTKYDLRFGFVKRQQQSVPLTDSELDGYDIYAYSGQSYQFVKIDEPLTVSPFRAFFMLPKSAAPQAKGQPVTRLATPALSIVLDGKEVLEAAIDTPNAAATAAPAYNLMGAAVGREYRGVVIRNGKKEVVR